VEFEQKGEIKAEYGTELLDRLSRDLKFRYGMGFGRRNILDMRRFYVFYPIWQTVSAELSWSHYVQLVSLDNGFARSFYGKQCVEEKWSVRELNRQKNSMLFERIALSKNKKEVIALSKRGQVIKTEKDIIKEPYILEFLGIPEDYKHSEKELEQKIIDNLQMFLLEMGKGFTFVKRQFRISFKNKHFYVDLVFYHRILRCFVLIDLKVDEVEHTDVGQMNMYLNYFGKEENALGDNPPIGIILGAYKDEVKIEYALGGISNKLFVSKYQLYLPKKGDLEKQVLKLLN
jgi:predicted nuclease of restriction endonuclease-like (RecB) superfamily